MLHHPSFTIRFSKPLKLKATLQAEENAPEVEPFEAWIYFCPVDSRVAVLIWTIKKNF